MWDSSLRPAPGARFRSSVLTTRLLRVGILIGNQNWSKLSRSGDVQLEIKLPWPAVENAAAIDVAAKNAAAGKAAATDAARGRKCSSNGCSGNGYRPEPEATEVARDPQLPQRVQGKS